MTYVGTYIITRDCLFFALFFVWRSISKYNNIFSSGFVRIVVCCCQRSDSNKFHFVIVINITIKEKKRLFFKCILFEISIINMLFSCDAECCRILFFFVCSNIYLYTYLYIGRYLYDFQVIGKMKN